MLGIATQNSDLGRRALLALALLFALLLAAPTPASARYAAIVIDAGTGEVLHEANADTRNYPASLAKMMTLYLAFEALEAGRLKPHQKLRTSRRAAGMPRSRLGLRHGERIRVEDAILALITKSANDAAVVLAETLGGTESKFARAMTRKARALGMKRTSFRNASGLTNRRQLSTARDMARLAQALIQDFPQRYHFFSTTKFSFRGRTFTNHNNLLASYAGTDGIKTGYTRASGYNLAASTQRNGRRVIAVVFGGRSARSRDRHIAKLLDSSFAKLAERDKNSPLLAAPRAKPSSVALVPRPSRKPRAEDAGGPPAPRRKPAALAARDGVRMILIPGGGTVAAAGSAATVTRGGHNGVDAAEVAARAGAWGVQVGAFNAPDPAKLAADRAVAKLPELLGHAHVVIPHIQGTRGRIYRARVMGLSEDTARSACRRLETKDMDCIVVTPKDRVKVALGRTSGG